MTHIRIYGEIHSSKNSRRIMRNGKTGMPFVAKSKAAKADEESFSLQLSCQTDKWKNMTSGKSYPLNIVFLFYRATRRLFDYVNIVQGVLDAMIEAGYIPDDCADYVIPHFLPYTINKEFPGCEITIK